MSLRIAGIYLQGPGDGYRMFLRNVDIYMQVLKMETVCLSESLVSTYKALEMDTECFSETLSSTCKSWIWRQYVSPKCRYLYTSVLKLKTVNVGIYLQVQKNNTDIFSTVRTSNLTNKIIRYLCYVYRGDRQNMRQSNEIKSTKKRNLAPLAAETEYWKTYVDFTTSWRDIRTLAQTAHKLANILNVDLQQRSSVEVTFL
jgi:hypothetical protein